MTILQKIIKYGIYLGFILPLVFTSRTMYPWHFGKTILFQILVEILIVLALIYFSLNKEKRIIKLNILDWAIFIFIGCQTLAAIFGINFSHSFWGNQQRAQGVFTWLHFGAFYFLIRQFIITKLDWRNLGIWIIIIAFLSSLLAWFGKYISFFDTIISKGYTLSGLIGNPIFFASYLIIPVFLSLAWSILIIKDNKKLGWLLAGASLLGLITLLFSQVRGAFIGVIAGVFIAWLLYWLFGAPGKIKKIVIIIGFSLILLVISLYIFNQKSDYLKLNQPALARLLNITTGEQTAKTRLMAWRAALEAWQDKPILGWGPENFQTAFDHHYNPEFLKFGFNETVWDKPHNYPLEVLSNTGTVGFISYSFLLILVYIYLIKIIKKAASNSLKSAFIILTGAVTAYIIQNSFAFETSNSLLIWVTIIALISFYYNKGKEEELAKYENKFLIKFLGWLAIIFIIITPFLIYKNYTLYKASVYMGDARDAEDISSIYLWQKNATKVIGQEVPFLSEQAVFLTQDIVSFDGQGKLEKKTLEAIAPKLIEIFEKEIIKYPKTYLFRFWLSEVYGIMGEYIDKSYFEKSNILLIEAGQFSPDRQHVPLLLSKNYLLQGRNKEGVEILEELVAKDPDFSQPHWFLGLALIQDNQKDRGVAELEKGMEFGLFYKSNIIYLIDIYAEREEYEKIISLYEKLIKDEPLNSGYYASLAATYAALGDNENVIINLNKAVELDPALADEAKLFLEQNGIDIEMYK